MLKYTEAVIGLAEVPDEITLAINISGCPIKCPDCHSKHLWEDIGEPLNKISLDNLIRKNKGISCIAFMGGDSNIPYLKTLFHWVKQNYPTLKTAWYSGQCLIISEEDVEYLDYIKVGPYNKEFGSLDNKGTNQRMYRIIHNDFVHLEDITSKFWKKEN